MNNPGHWLSGAPFIRLLLPLVAGILFAEWLHPQIRLYFFIIPFLLLVVLLSLKSKTLELEFFKGIILMLILFFLGFSLAVNNRYEPQKLNGEKFAAVLEEYPLEREKTFRAKIRLIEPDIQVLAYFEKTEEIRKAEPGMLLHFTGCPELIRNYGNPFEFDYKSYCLRNNIGHRIFLRQDAFHFFHDIKIGAFRHRALMLREKLLQRMADCGVEGETYKVISAITLGARDNIDPETTESFAKTGTLHILAVSGGNVAVVYFVLHVLFGFLRRKRAVIFYVLIILAGIWAYAIITGLSASVMRAATMFSFIIVGKNLRRNPDIYNVLASSAFILICIKPALIFDAGFQLSYAAVFAIVLLQPIIYRLVFFRYQVLDFLWVVLSVSIAAQLGTLPFSLFYFHQFPNYFWLSNLVVVPLVALFLNMTFFIILLQPIIPSLAVLTGNLLNLIGAAMLRFLQIVENLPYAVIENIYPSVVQITIITIFFISAACYIAYNKKKVAIISLSLLAVLLLIQTAESYKTLRRKEIVVFNVPGKTLLAFTAGNKTIWLSNDKNIMNFTKAYEGFRRIKSSEQLLLNEPCRKSEDHLNVRGNFINFFGMRIFFMPDKHPIDQTLPKCDVFFLSGNQKEMHRYLPEITAIGGKTIVMKISPPIILIKNSPSPENIVPGEGRALRITLDRQNGEITYFTCRPF